MIEKALINYLLSVPEINALLKTNVYYHRAPPKAVMPWLIITNAGGGRRSLTSVFTEAVDTLVLYVDSGKQFEGRTIMEMVQSKLENYRGDMGDCPDLYIWCETIRDLDIPQGGFRYIMSIHARYKFPKVTNFVRT